MNKKFENLIQAFLALFKKDVVLTQTFTSAPSPIAVGESAATQLGMDKLPFVFEEARTVPEREVDFLIANRNVAMVFNYLEAGYELNKKQLFNLYQSYNTGIDIKYNAKYKKTMLQYSGAITELVQDALRWSEKKEYPSLELLPAAYTHPLAEKFLEQRTKGYEFLKYIFEYLPEAYQESLDSFHATQQLLEKTIKNIPDYSVHQEGWLAARSCATEIKTALENVKKYHAQLYNQVVANNIDNLKSFIEETSQHILSETATGSPPSEELPLLESIQIEKFKKLPTASQEVLRTISAQAINLKQLWSEETEVSVSLTGEEKFFVENTVQNNVPHIIDKYLSITPTEKMNYKVGVGKTIESLLLESLQSIETNLATITDNYMSHMSHKKIQDLEVSHRYMVSKKM